MTDLEEDGLAVAADGAAHVLGAGQRGVAGHVLEHLGELAGAVVHHVPVHAVAVGHLLQRAEFQTGYLQGHDIENKFRLQSDCS